MIYIDFIKNKDGYFSGFYMKGHSGFNAAGDDIVCAAVSSAAYMTVNTITDVLKINADVSVQEGKMHIIVEDIDAKMCRNLFLGLMMHLSALQEQYKDNININCSSI